jgi:hypothetical protein
LALKSLIVNRGPAQGAERSVKMSFQSSQRHAKRRCGLAVAWPLKINKVHHCPLRLWQSVHRQISPFAPFVILDVLQRRM